MNKSQRMRWANKGTIHIAQHTYTASNRSKKAITVQSVQQKCSYCSMIERAFCKMPQMPFNNIDEKRKTKNFQIHIQCENPMVTRFPWVWWCDCKSRIETQYIVYDNDVQYQQIVKASYNVSGVRVSSTQATLHCLFKCLRLFMMRNKCPWNSHRLHLFFWWSQCRGRRWAHDITRSLFIWNDNIFCDIITIDECKSIWNVQNPGKAT